MSEQSIRLNYQRAIVQADKLTEIGRSIKYMADRDYEDAINGISSAWKGENANTYISKARALQGKIKATGQSLINTADEMRRKAQIIRDAELDALRIAQEREALGKTVAAIKKSTIGNKKTRFF